MRTNTMFVLMIIAALAFCLTASQPALASDEEEVLQIMKNFDKAINTADLDLMTSLYWQSPKYSGFGPPKSMAFLTQGWEHDKEMWRKMFEYPKGTYNSYSPNAQVQMLGDNVGIITGYSTITFNPPVVEEETSELLRYTTVVQKIGGNWLIVHGHTSMLPTE